MRSVPSSTTSSVRRRRPWAVRLLFLAFGLACAGAAHSVSASFGSPADLDRAAEEYVRLALALGRQASREIDFYFGPPRLALEARAAPLTLAAIESRAQALAARIVDVEPDTTSGARARRERLAAHVRALAAVAASTRTPSLVTFDRQARDVYGLDVVPSGPSSDAEAARAALSALLPGSGPLAQRLTAYRRRFVVPRDRRQGVMRAAMEACRARTRAHWALPDGERVRLAWDAGGPWGAWHRYSGDATSTIDIDLASLELVDSAVDLACHEAYPGHHAQFVLIDAAHPPIELTVAVVRSPASILREGAASYAVDLVFPPPDRLAFERDVLFPLAGLDPREAAGYIEVRALVRRVEADIAPLLRAYHDGRASREATAERLEQLALVGAPESLLRFVDELGAYVIGYGMARDLVASAVDDRARAAGVDRWTALRQLLIESDPGVLGRAAPPKPPLDRAPVTARSASALYRTLEGGSI